MGRKTRRILRCFLYINQGLTRALQEQITRLQATLNRANRTSRMDCWSQDSGPCLNRVNISRDFEALTSLVGVQNMSASGLVRRHSYRHGPALCTPSGTYTFVPSDRYPSALEARIIQECSNMKPPLEGEFQKFWLKLIVVEVILVLSVRRGVLEFLRARCSTAPAAGTGMVNGVRTA